MNQQRMNYISTQKTQDHTCKTMNTFGQNIKILTDPASIVEQIKPTRFVHQHILSDETIRKPPEKVKTRKDTQKAHILNKPRGKSGVVGVFRDKNKWTANISIDRVRIELYRGDSYEEAVQARKEGEKKRTEMISPKNKHLPRGVHQFIRGDKTMYVASYTKDRKAHRLYYGQSLSMAIDSRREWEKENGFANHKSLNCRSVSDKPFKKNKYGVRGVTKDQNYWRARAVSDGVSYELYHGKSMKKAIAARRRWEEKMMLTTPE